MVRKAGDLYELQDPTFGNTTWATYRVEVYSTLDPATWTALGGDVTSSGDTACIADVLTSSNRFYRIRVVP